MADGKQEKMNFSFSVQFIPLVLAMFFSFGLLVSLLRYIDSPVVKALEVILSGAFIWSMSHLFEYGSNNLEIKLFWVNVEYFGMFMVPVGWLILTFFYLGIRHLVTIRNIVIISAVPALTLLLNATNSYHGLMMYNVSLDHNGTFSVITRTPGIWFWVSLIYANALMLTGTALMAKRFFTPPRIQRKQIFLIVTAIAIPWISSLISIFNVFPFLRIDPSPSMIPVSVFLIIMALYPFNTFNVIPIARDFILENLYDGIVVVDASNRVIDYNPAFSKMFKTGKIKFSTPFAELAQLINVPSSILNKSEFNKREIICKINERTLAFEVSVKPVLINGDLIGRIFHFQEITEKKKFLESLNRAQKLESLGFLAGGIAHEFNNILSAVFGNIELAKEYSSDDRAKKFLDNALVCSDRAVNLIEQLITFSKGGAPSCRPAELFPFYKERITLLLLKSKVDVKYDIPADLPKCLIDKGQIGQVFDGIITNARESMPDGGDLFISAKEVNSIKPQNSKLKEGRYVQLVIKDSGSGIKDDILPYIFDPFFSTKKQGRGLGLSACLSIIEQHGGAIEVQSETGKGTVFTVYFPVA